MTRVLTALCLFLSCVLPAAAGAHGTMTSPLSRVMSCHAPWDNPENPQTSACKQAVAVGGPQPIYDWNAIRIGDAAGNSRSLIPDGRLCSGGNDKYAAFDAVRSDWYTTPMTPGARFTFVFTASAAHVGRFELYLTKQGFDPRQPLRWSDLEQFHAVTNPPLVDGAYQIPATLPSDRTGHHIVYAIWQRSDSGEAFYSCSDVSFGDNTPWTPTDLEAPSTPAGLRVTGTTASSVSLQWTASTDNVGVSGYEVLRDGAVVATTTDNAVTVNGLPSGTDLSFTVRARDDAGNRSALSAPVTARTDTTPTPTPSPTPTPTVTASPTPTPPAGTCTGFATTSDWGSGYVGEVTVRNAGMTRVDDWRYAFDLPAGSIITGSWSAQLAQSGQHVTFAPESWTRSIAPGGSARFGFQVSGAAKPVNCASTTG